MVTIRRAIDRFYSRTRGIDGQLDPNLDSRQIASFVSEKALQKLRSVLHGNRSGYRGTNVKIRNGRQLRLGRFVSLGSGVSINAMSRSGIDLGDNVTVDDFTIIRASGVVRNLGQGVSVGARSSIGAFSFIHGGGGVSIGKDCLLGPYVSIYSENHITERTDLPMRDQGESRQFVSIGDDVWLGSGSTILAGVSVGGGSIVAAGAVVTKDVLPGSIVGGVPARVIGHR